MATNAPVTKKILKKGTAAKAEEVTKKVATQKVIVNRELKYIYPKGCTDTLARKAFRQKTRNTLRKMQRDMAKLEGKDKKELEIKFKELQASVIAN